MIVTSSLALSWPSPAVRRSTYVPAVVKDAPESAAFELVNVTLPGPLTVVQLADTLLPAGKPSSVTVPLSLTAVLPITGLEDWVRVRERLAALPTIRKVGLVALSLQEATIEIEYLGSIDQLKASLAEAKLDLVRADPQGASPQGASPQGAAPPGASPWRLARSGAPAAP